MLESRLQTASFRPDHPLEMKRDNFEPLFQISEFFGNKIRSLPRDGLRPPLAGSRLSGQRVQAPAGIKPLLKAWMELN